METETEALTSADLLTRIQPLRMEIAGLRTQLDEGRQKQNSLAQEYDRESDADGDAEMLWSIRQRQNAAVTGIERIERKIQAKERDLQPLDAEYQRLRNAEQRAREEEEVQRFITEGVQRAASLYKQWRDSEKEFCFTIERLRNPPNASLGAENLNRCKRAAAAVADRVRFITVNRLPPESLQDFDVSNV